MTDCNHADGERESAYRPDDRFILTPAGERVADELARLKETRFSLTPTGERAAQDIADRRSA